MRIEATQRGRLAMDRMERLLRSQVCLVSTVDESATSYPVATANRDTVTFYADLSGGVNIFQHTLTFDPTLGTITDTARKVTGTAPITLASTSTTEQLAIKASRSGTNALFRYYGYPYPTPPGTVVQPNQELVPAAGGLSATDVKRIARIDIDFLVTGATVSTANIKSEMSNQVFVRIADPNGLPDQVAPERNPFDPSCT
jgi:hypothetical protein